jgi:uncharacterized protein (DUF362 family)
MEEKGTSRREFMKSCVAGAVVIGAGDALSFGRAAAKVAGGGSKVVVARDSTLRSGGDVNPQKVAALLDNAMRSYSGSRNAVDPWKHLVRKGEVIGLKVNCIAAPGLYSNTALVHAICERLQQAGIRPGDIVIWDRTERELKRAGFTLNSNPNQIRCMGTDAVGYEDQPESYGVASCRLSKILTRTCNAVINVPVLKHHGMAGMTGAMKNMYGVIDNPNRCHANRCNPHVADVYMLPTIRQKIRFTVCDVITSVFDGGPGFKPQYAYNYDGVMVSHDPVALDYCGWQILDKMRTEKGLKTLAAAGQEPEYIATAANAQHKLGTDDPRRINLVHV